MTQQPNNSNGWGKLVVGGAGTYLLWKAFGPEIIRLVNELAAALAQPISLPRVPRPQVSPPQTTPAEEAATPLLGLGLPGPLKAAPVRANPSPSIQFPDLEALREAFKLPPKPVPPVLPPPPEPDARWRDVIMHPSVVLVLGKRGSGKSALGYRLLELFRYRAIPYVVGVPSDARRSIPDWIGMAPSLEEVPAKATVLVDEAYLRYHARSSQAEENRAMSKLLNLSRQREQTLILISQEARQVDRNAASSANVVIFKEPGIMQAQFERPELRKLAEESQRQFLSVAGDGRRWAYVFAPERDVATMLANQLPSFWSPRLSTIFAAGQGTGATKKPETPTAHDKAIRARELRAQRRSYGEIARELGVSKPTVVNYLNDYPYRPR